MEQVLKNSWMIEDAATRYKVPKALLCALIEVESGWNPWAVRHEPGYKYLVDIKHSCVTAETERVMQQTSFGLIQILGSTARWLGYHEPFLTSLCEPVTGLKWGCRYLVHLYTKHHNWSDAVSAYNQGWPRRDPATHQYLNQSYVDKVMEAIRRYQSENPADAGQDPDPDSPDPV